MGNSFFIGWQDFHGYAVEKHIYHWGAVAVDQSPASRRRVGERLVSRFWHQPQNGLQVVASFHGRWPAGIERSVSPAASGALAHASEMDSTNCANAQATSPLGPQENPDLLAAPVRAGAGHGDHCPVAATVAIGKST